MAVQTFKSMIGVTMRSVDSDDENMSFTAEDGRVWSFDHFQDCCEHVRVEDICGDLADLVGSPIVVAEEINNIDEPYACEDSYT